MADLYIELPFDDHVWSKDVQHEPLTIAFIFPFLKFEFKTKEDFDAYRDEVLSQIPKSIRKRFRQGGFSKWGKDWLPVIELGPFDVEPGPVRDMWMDMFHNVRFLRVLFVDNYLYLFSSHTQVANKMCFALLTVDPEEWA